MKRFALCALGLVAVAASADMAHAQALDRVKLLGDVQVRGTVDSMSSFEVVIKQSASRRRKIPVNQVTGVVFAGEPTGLSQARLQVQNSKFEDARQALNAIALAGVKRDHTRQEIEFYKALCGARLALEGSGEVRAAAAQMLAFAEANTNHYHYLEAAATLGDLLVDMGNVDAAVKWYEKLAAAPWPDYKIRSAALAGQALMSEGRFAEALTRYDQALAVTASRPAAMTQKTAARLNKAICLAETGDLEQGVRIIHEVIRQAGPEEALLHAKAYNALGGCQRKAGNTKDALFAYLHVDVLYHAIPDQHATALANLSTLWAAVGQAERAREAKSLLEERYPNYGRAN